jgi:hypothetical protein
VKEVEGMRGMRNGSWEWMHGVEWTRVERRRQRVRYLFSDFHCRAFFLCSGFNGNYWWWFFVLAEKMKKKGGGGGMKK